MEKEGNFRAWHIGIPLGVLLLFFLSNLYSSGSLDYAFTNLLGPFAGMRVTPRAEEGWAGSSPVVVIVCSVLFVGVLLQTPLMGDHVNKSTKQSVWAFCWLLWCISSWLSKVNALI